VPLDNVVFWVFAPISVASAIGMLVVRNAVHAALFLIVNFFTLAVMYLLLDAPSCSPSRSSSTPARSWCCSCS
jgi:NADH:ubiquinone oxidoreductase subunit 6 (subunit J)